MLKGTISYSDTAYNAEKKGLTNFVVNLDDAEANRIKGMLDADVIKCNTVFRCETTYGSDNKKKETYVNMLHVRQIMFEEE